MYKVLACLLLVSCASNYEDVTVSLKVTEQGYWYAKMQHSDLDNFKEFSSDVGYSSYLDLNNIESRNLVSFLSGDLPENSDSLSKLNAWKHIQNKKLKIPTEEKISLENDVAVLQKSLQQHLSLLQNVKHFFGISKPVHLYGYYSRLNKDSHASSGNCLKNADYKTHIDSAFLSVEPALESNTLSIKERIEIVVHEFSHAMSSVYGRQKLEESIAECDSPNSVIASWHLDEALAQILGNAFVSKDKIDWQAIDYTKTDFSKALYKVVREYCDKRQKIDKQFFRKAMKVFDELHPNAYITPKFYFGRVIVVHSDDIECPSEYLMSKIYCISYNDLKFSQINENSLKEIRNSNATVLVIFSKNEELNVLGKDIPRVDSSKAVNVIRKNKRTYVFIKACTKSPWKKAIDNLLKN